MQIYKYVIEDTVVQNSWREIYPLRKALAYVKRK